MFSTDPLYRMLVQHCFVNIVLSGYFWSRLENKILLKLVYFLLHSSNLLATVVRNRKKMNTHKQTNKRVGSKQALKLHSQNNAPKI